MVTAEVLHHDGFSRRDILSFSKRKTHSGRPPTRINHMAIPAQPPHQGKPGFTRRQAIITGIIGTATVVATLAEEPWNWFNHDQNTFPSTTPTPDVTPTPEATPTPVITPTPDITATPEVLDQRIVGRLQNEVLNPANYPLSLRQKMINFWLQGGAKTIEYTKDDQSYLLSFNPAKPALPFKSSKPPTQA